MKNFTIMILSTLLLSVAQAFATQPTDIQINLSSSVPQLSDLLRDENGKVKYFEFYLTNGATSACPSGSRLPTVRELAILSQSMGAKGILEMSQVGAQVPTGYSLVTAINPDKTQDNFYFNKTGYRRPKGDLGDCVVWSSSTLPNEDTEIFALDCEDGDVANGTALFAYRETVRCVVSH